MTNADDFHSCRPDRMSLLHLPPGMEISKIRSGEGVDVAIHGFISWFCFGECDALGGRARRGKVYVTCKIIT